jgi:biopolymer transport protein ExbB
MTYINSVFCRGLILIVLALLFSTSQARAWWDREWTVRKKITIDTTATGVPISEPIGQTAVLIRLHDGNFQFAAAREDAADIRFVAADDKTLLSYHIEKFDALLNEAFVWVKLPDLKPNAATSFWLYYGNSGPKAVKVEDSKATYDADTVLVYHFSETGTAPADSTSSGANAENAGVPVNGALIGGGLRMPGAQPVRIPAAAPLMWPAGATVTWSAWIKPAVLQPAAVLFTRREEDRAFSIGIENGVPYVEVTGPSGTQRSTGGTPLAVNAWRHLAVVAAGTQMTVYLDGESYGTLASGMPALNSVSLLGKEAADAGESAVFNGEIDELQISKATRPVGALKLAAITQAGGDQAGKALIFAEDETAGHGAAGELAKHFSLISDISKSLTFDGWVVIALCTILAIVGWVVTVAKFVYLNRIQKATDAFLRNWQHLSADLTALDHADEKSIKSMGGKASSKNQKVMAQSPLYHIYQIGSSEIQHRLVNARNGLSGLSGRSIQAIRATLDGGLVREVQRLNGHLVFLTIGIAGGPYLGLLGTVIGVMITFAVIARSGEVEVNSIAPGIAGALLATVAGLAVAIPALFAYSYISSRIKDAVSEMQIFIDEFVAKIAEFYSSPND